MDPVTSRLSQVGAKGGALALVAAVAAYLVSFNPLALLIFPVLISVVELLCLIEGPWTAPLLQRLPAVRGGRRQPRR